MLTCFIVNLLWISKATTKISHCQISLSLSTQFSACCLDPSYAKAWKSLAVNLEADPPYFRAAMLEKGQQDVESKIRVRLGRITSNYG